MAHIRKYNIKQSAVSSKQILLCPIIHLQEWLGCITALLKTTWTSHAQPWLWGGKCGLFGQKPHTARFGWFVQQFWWIVRKGLLWCIADFSLGCLILALSLSPRRSRGVSYINKLFSSCCEINCVSNTHNFFCFFPTRFRLHNVQYFAAGRIRLGQTVTKCRQLQRIRCFCLLHKTGDFRTGFCFS